jgi:signal transduction histidine kinase
MPEGPRSARSSSIRLRIAVALAVVALTLIGLLVSMMRVQRPVGATLQHIAEGYLPMSRQVALLRQDHELLRRDLSRLVRRGGRGEAGEGAGRDELAEDVEANLAIASVLLDGLRRGDAEPEGQASLSRVAGWLDGLESAFKRYFDEAAALDREGATLDPERLEERRRSLRTSERVVDEDLSALERETASRVARLVHVSEQQQARSLQIASGLIVGSTLAVTALLAGVLYALRPVARLTEEAARVADGDYGRRVEEGRDDEVGRLAREFNRMARAVEARETSLSERNVELARASASLQRVLDAMDDALVVVAHGQVALANPAAVDHWDVHPGQPVPPGLLQVLEDPAAPCIDRTGRRWQARVVPYGADGASLAVLTDVTDAEEAAARLARSERLAALGQMLATITHEIRNPLNAMSLNVELLDEEVAGLTDRDDSPARTLLQRIAREVERLTTLSQGYLALARRPVPHRVDVDLALVVREVIALLSAALAQRGVTLTLVAPSPARAWVDADQCSQAAINLVRNAAEAGARRVDIAVEAHSESVRVTVDDDGPGIPEGDRQQVLEPFFSTRAQGTGLGLAVVRQVLDDHGGGLVLEGSPAGGLRVVMTWPLAPRPDMQPPEATG